MLEVEGLVVRYGPVEALKGVALRVAQGEMVTIIGANGAGKTTLLRTIAGLLRPASGSIRYRGDDVTGRRSPVLVRRGLVLVPEGRAILQRLTVGENLQLGAYARGRPRPETLEMCLERFPILRERWRFAAGLLSGGEQQLLAIARALCSEPALLCLDEPSLGLAPRAVETIFSVVAQLRDRVTMLLVEQNAAIALSLADRGYVLETGRVVMEGPSAVLAEHKRVREAYLGVVADG